MHIDLKKASSKSKTSYVDDLDICNSCSTTDCTGLIPAAPASDSEYDSYNDIYSFQPPEVTDKSSNDKLAPK